MVPTTAPASSVPSVLGVTAERGWGQEPNTTTLRPWQATTGRSLRSRRRAGSPNMRVVPDETQGGGNLL